MGFTTASMTISLQAEQTVNTKFANFYTPFQKGREREREREKKKTSSSKWNAMYADILDAFPLIKTVLLI